MAKMRVALAQIDVCVGDIDANADTVCAWVERACTQGAHLVAFGEMALTGYPPEDLVLRRSFVTASRDALVRLARRLDDQGAGEIAVIVGYLDCLDCLGDCPQPPFADEAGHTADVPQNSAAVLWHGEVVARYAKHHLPNYGVFDEARYFAPGTELSMIRLHGVDVALTICEDLWQEGGPIAAARAAGAGLVVSINGSPYEQGKSYQRDELCARRAREAGAALAYVNLVGGQDELVFDGDSLVVDAAGRLIARAAQFEETLLITDLDLPLGDLPGGEGGVLVVPVPGTAVPDPAVREVAARPGGYTLVRSAPRSARPGAAGWLGGNGGNGGNGAMMGVHRVELSAAPPPPFATRPPQRAVRLAPDAELYTAIVVGTRDYVRKNGFSSVVLGLSGGIDSALVATIAVDALGADAVHTVAMPSAYSSAGSLADAAELAHRQGTRHAVIPIQPTVDAFHAALDPAATQEPGPPAAQEDVPNRSLRDRPGPPDHAAFGLRGLHGLAAENLQARVRGTTLMALSNEHGHLVLTTGNKSELATGFSTLYGDSAGGFAPIKDVLKTTVWALARWRNAEAARRGETPPIPEEIVTKPPSAELAPDQLDSDRLPDYAVLDAVLDDYVSHDRDRSELVALGHEPTVVDRVIRLVDLAEYKRRQNPPGPKVTSKAFGRDRRLPITSRWRAPAP